MFHFFFSSLKDSKIIQVTENTNIFAQEEISIKKTPPSFLMTLFDLNQAGDVVSTKNCAM